jgi:hypothetical protein
MTIDSDYLTAEGIKAFLLHHDPLVRARVAGYFRDAASRDTDLIPLILASCDEYREDDNLVTLNACSDFPLTEESFFLVLGALSWASDAGSVSALNHVLATMPLAVFERNRTLMRRPRVDPGTRKRLETRLDLSMRAPGELWQRLRKFSDDSRDEWCPDCLDQSQAQDLVEALTPHREPDSLRLVERLGRGEFDGEWLEAFVIDLLGARRVKEAVPVLVSFVASDRMDDLPGKAADALVKISDVGAIPKLVRQTEWNTYYHMLEATRVLGCVKHPSAEAALFGLLETQEDPAIRSILCDAVLAHFPSEGWELIRREIRTGDPLRRELLMVGLMVTSIVRGRELLEAEVWRWELLEAKQEALREAVLVSGQNEEKDYAEPARPSPRRPGKPGRNQPCPCGSGKKFKKCCALN